MPPLSFAAWFARSPWRQRALHALRAQPLPVYIVGGTVRDALLGRDSCDLDLAVAAAPGAAGEPPLLGMPSGAESRPALALTRFLANALHGAFVVLDSERDVGRIVLHSGEHVDVAALRAEGIEADLWARDFTVNAMAVPLERLEELLDPTGGQRDLLLQRLRMVHPHAFDDDPLRILRGVRLRGSLGFALAPDTEALARRGLPGLLRVSPERIRDELAQILALESAASSLAYAGSLGVYDRVIPELLGEGLAEPAASAGPCWPSGVESVACLEALFGDWHVPRDSSAGAHTRFPSPCARDGSLELALGLHLASLADHWAEELSSGRRRWLSLKLAALLGGAATPPAAAAEVLRRLRFSAREANFATTALRSAAAVRSWSDAGDPSPLTIYRYFRASASDGVDGAILALVAERATTAHLGASAAQPCLQRASRLLNAWFAWHAAVVDPPQLLSGRDLLHALRLSPGPRVGALLELLREAQVQGLVHTRGEGLAYLRGLQKDVARGEVEGAC
jgi:tRNA nucleotidyltransferase/poly(A) polymerase